MDTHARTHARTRARARAHTHTHTHSRYFRPTWKLNNTEPVAENYYPVNSRIYIRVSI